METETNSEKNSAGNFKTHIIAIERGIKKDKRALAKFILLEERSRKKWTKGYHDFMQAARQLADLKTHNTKMEDRLRKKIENWPADTARLTQERDAHRKQIEHAKEELTKLGTRLATLKEQEINEIKTVDDIVVQVFGLNAAAVQASVAREDCLKRHVFPRLIDERGNLRRQVSFTSSNGLRRIVAMVNTMTIIKGDLAAEAKQEIQRFFERFQKPAKIDPNVDALYELTRQLLVEKTDFKVGPDLYRFLAMELDAEIFPELARAQTLLRQSIRSERTTSYIRIYERKSRADNWEVVPQS